MVLEADISYVFSSLILGEPDSTYEVRSNPFEPLSIARH